MSKNLYTKGNEGKLFTPWDMHYKSVLTRWAPTGKAPYILEFGINYFIVKLESLGLKTQWSCEGHPTGFYIVIRAPFGIATKIAYASTNYAELSITHGVKHWDVEKQEVIYFKSPSWRMALLNHGPSYEVRNGVLRELSIQWEEEL